MGEEWLCLLQGEGMTVRDLTPGSLALSPVPLCSWQNASIGSFSGKSVPLKQVASLYLGRPFPPEALFSTFSTNFVVFSTFQPSLMLLCSLSFGDGGVYDDGY